VIELYNSAEFIDLLRKSPNHDFGNICINFDSNNFFEFKFVKERNSVYFDSRILKEGRKEYDYLRLLISIFFPKLIFEPQIGVSPKQLSGCSICQFDDIVPSMTSGKLNDDLKWICLDKKCQENSTHHSLELCDTHFISKYENDFHTSQHKMAMLQKTNTVGLNKRVLWEPLFYFHTQAEFLEKYQYKKCSICNKNLGLKRWHCLECSEVRIIYKI